jgi:hypothetical protein
MNLNGLGGHTLFCAATGAGWLPIGRNIGLGCLGGGVAGVLWMVHPLLAAEIGAGGATAALIVAEAAIVFMADSTVTNRGRVSVRTGAKVHHGSGGFLSFVGGVKMLRR